MALEHYLDSNSQLAVPIEAPTYAAGDVFESLSSSVSLKKVELYEAGVTSHLVSSFQNLPTSIVRMAYLNANIVSGNIDSTVLNNSTNPGPSMGASSLVTDANWPLQSGAHLHTNMESYFNLPLSSNTLSTSVIDGNSLTQQISHLDQSCHQGRKRQQPQWQASSTVTSPRQVSVPTAIKQEAVILTQMWKKPRLDFNQEDVLHQQIIQQLLQRQGSLHLQNHNPQLQASIQQHRLQNQLQQHILPSIPQFRGVHSQQHKQQMRHLLQQKASHQVSALQPVDGGICARRLMQYLYHLRHRPHDNNISYWRKFIAEYYAPCAKKRWCLSLYDNIIQEALGVFSLATMEAWHCDICGSKSGKGFEAMFEILPRLSKIKFDSGVLDELLFLDLPHERRFPTGLMMLEYKKAVQECVYEKFRVVREGQLRIIFSHDLKILSWEFCAKHQEKLLARGLVAPQINQLVQAAQKYQSTVNNSGSDEVSPQDLQSNCNMFLTAGRHLTRNMELLVNDLGFSNSYIRCLQIAQVVDSMKDLMTFSHDRNIGPLESLKTYPREDTITHPGPSKNMNSAHMTNDEYGSGEPALPPTNHYKKSSRQSSADSTVGTVKPENPCSTNCCSQIAISSPPLTGLQSSGSGVLQNPPISRSLNSEPSQGSNKNLQQCMVRKLLQEMGNKSRTKLGQDANGRVNKKVSTESSGSTVSGLPARDGGTSMIENGIGVGNSRVFGNVTRIIESFNANSKSNSPRVCDSNTPISPQVIWAMSEEFSKNGALNGEWKGLDHSWNA